MQKTMSIFLFLVLILGITQTPFLPSLQTDSSYNIQAPLGIAFADSKDGQDDKDINDETNSTENNDETNSTENNDETNSTENNDETGDENDSSVDDSDRGDNIGNDINATDNNADDHDNEDTDNEDANDQNNDDHMAGNETQAQQNAQEKISELQKRINKLEQRLQSLLAMFESGKYFGTTFGAEQTKSYDLSFNGTATSIDGSAKDNMKGEIFFESLVTGDDVSKFRVTGGVVSIGNSDYDLIFGKARVTNLDSTDSMVLIAQTVDDQGNAHTLKILLDSTLPSGLGSEPVNVSLKMPQSKIAGQWTLSATGQLSVI